MERLTGRGARGLMMAIGPAAWGPRPVVAAQDPSTDLVLLKGPSILRTTRR